MLFQGLKFGLILQLAVGPVCLMVFNTASNIGLLSGLIMALSVTLVDALYISLAGVGLTKILHNQKIKQLLKVFGCIVLVVFGLNNIAEVFSWHILPAIKLFSTHSQQGVFLQGILLTLSNPLTIIFWGGIFSVQVIERNLNKNQLVFFALGCILATFIFISLIACIGSIVHRFISQEIIGILNVSIGILIIYFGIKLVMPRQ